jgi:juvenile hormone epoxide hydrolase
LSIIKTAIASFFPSYFIEDPKYISWMYPFGKEFMFLLQETGYFHLQGTKPDTIGIGKSSFSLSKSPICISFISLLALNANPVGLAAWILEKFSTATNREYRKRADGGFENDFTLDSLLDNIMIYYLSNSATTSMRIYKETFNKAYPMDRVAVEVPTGCAHFKNEIQHQFNFLTQERFKNIIHNSYFDHGGHFAAMQVPEVLYEDFVKFVRKTLEYERCVALKRPAEVDDCLKSLKQT